VGLGVLSFGDGFFTVLACGVTKTADLDETNATPAERPRTSNESTRI